MQDSNTKVIDLTPYSVDDLRKAIKEDNLQWDATNEQGENLFQQALKDKKKIEFLFKELENLKSKDMELYKRVINYQVPYEKKYSPYNVMQPKGMTVPMYIIKYCPWMIESFSKLPEIDWNIINSNMHNAAAFACADPFVDRNIQ